MSNDNTANSSHGSVYLNDLEQKNGVREVSDESTNEDTAVSDKSHTQKNVPENHGNNQAENEVSYCDTVVDETAPKSSHDIELEAGDMLSKDISTHEDKKEVQDEQKKEQTVSEGSYQEYRKKSSEYSKEANSAHLNVEGSEIDERSNTEESKNFSNGLSSHSDKQETTSSSAEDKGSIAADDTRQISPAPSRGEAQSRKFSLSSVTTTGSTVDNTRIFKKIFESILITKEAKKDAQLKDAVQKALDFLNDPNLSDHSILLDALQRMTQVPSDDMKTRAVDTFAKLFDHISFTDNEEKVRVTDTSVDIISSCFSGEGTDPELELQVVRALMHSILLMPCHGATLLKAVRQIYNIFIFSLSARNQSVAQGTLTQVIGAVFGRIDVSSLSKSRAGKFDSNSNFKNSTPMSKENLSTQEEEEEDNAPKLTLENLENINDSTYDTDRVNGANHASEKDEDLAVKDAFLIFRAMCKLSVKPLEADVIDMKAHSVRSKLLSLHIIHTILKEHIEIFLSPDVVIFSNLAEKTRLINAVRQYICLALSRNSASSLAPVFELTLEIFWIIISNLRSEFKREIPVFWDEIYFPVAEMKTSTSHQKRYLLSIIERLCNDSRIIIEFYLNYDCDPRMPNIYENTVDYLTKLSLSRVEASAQQRSAYRENKRRGISVYDIGKIANLTSNTMSSKPPEPDVYNLFPLEYALKITSIGCIVASLRSLYSWAHKGINNNNKQVRSSVSHHPESAASLEKLGNTSGLNQSEMNNSNDFRQLTNSGDAINDSDDPEQFENSKQRKNAFLEGIRIFNQKGKKGIKLLLEKGFIKSADPNDIANFLLETDGIDKSAIGEYLGEANPENVSIMHAFVDQMEFKNSEFVDAMRRFLQAFRLPGEGQKIDRFMLKFAERYVLGNPNVFANADTAYILAYSIVMLNTDQHSPQVKNRMTFDNFVTNNSGIDDGKDLPIEFLEKIYKEIQENEIKLQSEQHAALISGDPPVTPVATLGIFGGRDVNREAYIHASKEMSTKAEKLMRNLGKKTRSDEGVFYVASSVLHVKSIFDTMWMSFLAGLTSPFKEFDEKDTIQLCLEGIKLSICIASMFDLDYARTSFVGALVQFENLNNFEEMKPKNVDAIHVMLEIAVTPQMAFKTSWIQILTAISQLERLQLIAQGVDKNSIPDVSVARLVNRGSTETTSVSSGIFSSFTSSTSASQVASNKFHNQHLNEEVAKLLTKTDLEVSIDKVFTNSANLSGDSIVDFVKALSEVSSEEIESSGTSSSPRMFSLQKVVDVCYYNMSRIRLEWSKLWSIMEETFNSVASNHNSAVAFFALDSLRQLSMRFLEIEELANFKFQKEFLRPFEHVMSHSNAFEVKDMALDCINNMILARAKNIKSGWKTIFGVLTASARENNELLVMKTFKMANWLNKEYSEEIFAQDSFADLVVCFTELAKNERYQKVSLLSLDVLLSLISKVADISFNSNSTIGVNGVDKKSSASNDMLVKLWFPVLFGFYDIIMTGRELEVRSRASTSLFETLFQYGEHFESDFWDLVCHQLLFPIFAVLNNIWQINIDDNNDTLSVWLSTTLIQALKSMIDLLGHFFQPLGKMLGEYLSLITSCICQENDTVARIGRECLSTLLIDNAQKFNTDQWEEVTLTIKNLFELTTAEELFTSDPLRNQGPHEDQEYGDVGSKVNLENGANKVNTSNDYDLNNRTNKEKSSIVVKSVLQLVLIQALSGLFENDIFYEAIPYTYMMKIAELLKRSYDFARTFNDDYELRVRLWNAGIIERLPNLLKQESSSSAVYINVLFRLYCDDEKTDRSSKSNIVEQIIPLCNSITERYSEFDETNQQRNISTWRPVIIEIFQGYVELDDEDFLKYAPSMYDLTLKLFSKSLSPDLRPAIRIFFARVSEDFIKPKNE